MAKIVFGADKSAKELLTKANMSPDSLMPLTKEVIVEKLVEVEKKVLVEVPVEKVVERVIEVPVERIVYVDRPVEVIKEVTVEKLVDRPTEIVRTEVVRVPEIKELTRLVFRNKTPKWAWLALAVAIVEMLVIITS